MKFPQDAARLMGRLQALDARAKAAEEAILAAAHKREAVVCARMEKLRPRVLLKRGAAREYQVLALERRRLAMVIGMARSHGARGVHEGAAPDKIEKNAEMSVRA